MTENDSQILGRLYNRWTGFFTGTWDWNRELDEMPHSGKDRS